MLLDGGCGEFIRRCVNANLEYRGRQAINTKNTKQFLSYMPKERADVFGREQLHEMQLGLYQHTEIALSEMPEMKTIGLGNWIETWNIRQRVSNISSRSQQVLDDIIRNYMPYIQRQVIDAAMKVPAVKRAQNLILSEILAEYAAELRKIPTIRNGLRMRYGTGRIEGKIHAILRKRQSYKNNTNARFMVKHQERICDMANDSQHHLKDFYGAGKINNLIKNYYNVGKGENELLWWLTFESYRQQFGIIK